MRCPAGEVSINLNGILAGIFSILWAYYMAGKKKKEHCITAMSRVTVKVVLFYIRSFLLVSSI